MIPIGQMCGPLEIDPVDVITNTPSSNGEPIIMRTPRCTFQAVCEGGSFGEGDNIENIRDEESGLITRSIIRSFVRSETSFLCLSGNQVSVSFNLPDPGVACINRAGVSNTVTPFCRVDLTP